MPVVGVLAEAHVGEERQPGRLGAKRAQRALDDAVVVPRARALGVLLLGDPEQEDRADAERVRARPPRARARRPSAARSRAGPRPAGRCPRPGRRRAASRRRRARATSRARARAARRCAAGAEAGWRGSSRGSVCAAGLAGRRVLTSRPRDGAARARPPRRPAAPARSSHGSSSMRSPKNSQIARPAAIVGSATSTPGMPYSAPPARSPKITSSGWSRSALAITFGTTTWPSTW